MFVYIEIHSSPLVGRYSLPPEDTTLILQILSPSCMYSLPPAGTPVL